MPAIQFVRTPMTQSLLRNAAEGDPMTAMQLLISERQNARLDPGPCGADACARRA
jgi:hypothetical protein